MVVPAQAEFAEQVTSQAYRAGQLMVAPTQLELPPRCTRQMNPAGQSMVAAEQPSLAVQSMLQRPLEYGADIVMHSATKFLNGHSDMVGGIAVTANDELAERLGYLQNSIGAISGPFDSFLALRGLKTLAIRMERHCSSAMAIAEWLEQDDRVESVLYPGLDSHPQHELAAKQMNGFGGIVTFFIKGNVETARSFLERSELFALAESLGGVESLVNHPAIMTHASVPEDVRAALGINDQLIRLSVGIEFLDDLIADIDYALAG